MRAWFSKRILAQLKVPMLRVTSQRALWSKAIYQWPALINQPKMRGSLLLCLFLLVTDIQIKCNHLMQRNVIVIYGLNNEFFFFFFLS